MKRAEISLADYLRAVANLKLNASIDADKVRMQRILKLLQLESIIGPDVGAVDEPGINGRDSPITIEQPDLEDDGENEPKRDRYEAEAEPSAPIDEELVKPEFELTRINATVGAHPPPRKLSSLESLLEPRNKKPYKLKESQLLKRRTQRALLTTVMSTPSSDGPIDIRTLVEQVANGEAIEDYPRLSLPTLRHGAQVLVDFGEGMTPFRQDLRDMQSAIRRTMGEDGLQILRFSGCPSRGAGIGPRKNWTAYNAPAQGTPVLVLSDLGINRVAMERDRASTEEWLDFASKLTQLGCLPLAFVPVKDPANYLQSLARKMVLLPWDRNTTLNRVKRLLVRAGRA